MSSETVTANMELALKTFLEKEHTEAEGKMMVKQLVRLQLIYTSLFFNSNSGSLQEGSHR
jgi:hypothetical protein